MPISEHFYNSTTRSMIVAFGSLFNDITILRPDQKQIIVPLVYGSKEKWYTKLRQNPDLEQREAITLPRMGFIISDISYDSTRKVNTLEKLIVYDNETNSIAKRLFQPVPYIMAIELSLWTKSMDDGLQVIEQILPFFTPSFTVTVVEQADFSIKRDIPIVLTGISTEYSIEGGYDNNRLLEWTLTFDIKTNFYGPTDESNIIKEVTVNTINGYTDKLLLKQVVTTDPIDAQPIDDYGFTEVMTEY